MEFGTLSSTNLFSFTCPIFDQNVFIGGCVKLRNSVYMGKVSDNRRGCQVCIKDGKCPAAEIVRRIAFGATDATDACFSETKKEGKLPADVLQRVAAVIIPDSRLQQYSVSNVEVLLIQSSRQRIEAQIASAPRAKVEARIIRTAGATETSKTTAQRVHTPVAITPTKTQQAALTGDLTAALNV